MFNNLLKILTISPALTACITAISLVFGASTYVVANLIMEPNKRTIENILLFSQHLSYSNSKQENVLLTYNELTHYQKKTIDSSPYLKSRCSLGFCQLLTVKDYPADTYAQLSYKENQLTSFKLVSTKYQSIFNKFGSVPFAGWNSLIKRHTIDNLNPDESTLFKGVTVYSALPNNIDSPVEYSTCLVSSCVNVYNYVVPNDLILHKDVANVN